MTAKKQDRVQSALETQGDQKSDENMSVPLGENIEVYLHGVLCEYESTLQQELSQGVRFTRNALSSSWLRTSD